MKPEQKSKMHQFLKLAKQGRSDYESSLDHLEKAHLISQSFALEHFLVHLEMFKLAVRHKQYREILGQIPRLVFAMPASLIGKAPKGNVGSTKMGLFEVNESNVASGKVEINFKSLLSTDVLLRDHFHCEDFDLIEVKKIGAPQTAQKSEVYQWLKIDPDGKVRQLTFLSMSEGARVFADGQLVFHEESGEYSNSAGKWVMKRRNI